MCLSIKYCFSVYTVSKGSAAEIWKCCFYNSQLPKSNKTTLLNEWHQCELKKVSMGFAQGRRYAEDRDPKHWRKTHLQINI